MDSDGTRDARGTQANPVPRPAGPQDAGGTPTEAAAVPPRPTAPPAVPPLPDGSAFLGWLRAPRPEAAPGVWRFRYKPRPEQEPERIPARQLLSGALIAFLVGWLVWSLLWNGYLGGWWVVPLDLFTPDSWRHSDNAVGNAFLWYGYYSLIALAIMLVVGRLGRWGEVWRRYGPPAWAQAAPAAERPPAPEQDPAEFLYLRQAGAAEAADRLAAEARTGLMRDVDHARIARAWQGVRSGRHSMATFTSAVLSDGAAACLHPSGERDLPARHAPHDLVTGQVRLGTTVDDPRNPYHYRGAGLALGPELLGTSLLAVGPAGSGKTGALIRPLAESLCLHALAGRAPPGGEGAGAAARGPPPPQTRRGRVGPPPRGGSTPARGGAP
ncbi:ATP-binding protein, partial [Streptomyces sp. NPDC059629]